MTKKLTQPAFEVWRRRVLVRDQIAAFHRHRQSLVDSRKLLPVQAVVSVLLLLLARLQSGDLATV